MFDEAVAGFVILGTNLLIDTFELTVLQYSHLELGSLSLAGFAGMLIGLALSRIITSNPQSDPMKEVPFGAILVLISSCWLSESEAGSGLADMWSALLVRGEVTSILYVTVTIHILRSFSRRQMPE